MYLQSFNILFDSLFVITNSNGTVLNVKKTIWDDLNILHLIFFFRQTVAEFFDLTLLKDLVYVNIIFGLALTFFSDLTFFTLEPLFLDKKHLSKVSFFIIFGLRMNIKLKTGFNVFFLSDYNFAYLAI